MPRRQRRTGQLSGQAAALDQFHGEIRPAVDITDVVKLHDVGVGQSGHRHHLALEALLLIRPGVGAGEKHLQSDGAVQSHVPRPVNNAHAAVAEYGLHFVARRPGQDRFVVQVGSGRCVRAQGRWEKRIQFALEAANALPAAADLWQQLQTVAADFFRRRVVVQERVEQLLQPRIVAHGASFSGP